MKSKLIILIFFFFTIGIAKGQVTFVKTISDTANLLSSSSVLQKNDGSYFVNAWSGNSISNSTLLIKCNSIGNVDWSKRYERGEFYSSILELSNGEMLLYGNRSTLAKSDSLGNLIWVRDFVRGTYFFIYSIESTSDSGFIMVGAHQIVGDIFLELVKLDSDGHVVWSKESDIPAVNLTPLNFVQLNEGGYMIAGSYMTPTFTREIFILKTDSLGNTIWSKYISGSSDIVFSGVVQNADLGFSIFGQTSTGLSLIRIDSASNIIWSKEYDIPSYVKASKIIKGPDDGYIASCLVADSVGAYVNRMCMMRIDQNGGFEYSRSYDRFIDAVNVSFSATSDSGYIVVGTDGYSSPVGTVNIHDVRIIKTNSLFETPCNSRPEFFVESNFTSSLSNGLRLISGSIVDTTITIAQANYNLMETSSCKSISVEEDDIINSVLVFPNPFIDVFEIRNTSSTGQVDVYSILGEKLVDQKADNQTTQVRVDHLSKGIYFLKYSEKDLAIVRRIVKQ